MARRRFLAVRAVVGALALGALVAAGGCGDGEPGQYVSGDDIEFELFDQARGAYEWIVCLDRPEHRYQCNHYSDRGDLEKAVTVEARPDGTWQVLRGG